MLKYDNMSDGIKDLIQFKSHQIEALQKRLSELESKVTQLESYLFEVTSDGCPEFYKQVVRKEIFKNN